MQTSFQNPRGFLSLQNKDSMEMQNPQKWLDGNQKQIFFAKTKKLKKIWKLCL